MKLIFGLISVYFSLVGYAFFNVKALNLNQIHNIVNNYGIHLCTGLVAYYV